MIIAPLGSGSYGNSIYVESESTRILIDAGLSGHEIIRRMAELRKDARQLDAIVVTHEHPDHIRSVGVLSRRFRLPVIIHPSCLSSYPQIGSLHDVIEFGAELPIEFRDLWLEPFSVPHDAVEPVGFVLHSGRCKVGIATDLGKATHLVKDRLKGCDGIILESNHDRDMLLEGPYPWKVKQRVKSHLGHLSNSQSAELFGALDNPNLQWVIIGHISKVNNHPDKIKEAFNAVVGRKRREEIDFFLASQSEPMEVTCYE